MKAEEGLNFIKKLCETQTEKIYLTEVQEAVFKLCWSNIQYNQIPQSNTEYKCLLPRKNIRDDASKLFSLIAKIIVVDTKITKARLQGIVKSEFKKRSQLEVEQKKEKYIEKDSRETELINLPTIVENDSNELLNQNQKDITNNIKKNPNIFIAHSEENKYLAKLLYDIIGSSFEIQEKNIICYGINATPKDNHTIKKDLEKSCSVITIITYESLIKPKWLMIELGAAWVLGKTIMVILGPNLTYNDLPSTIDTHLKILTNDKNFDKFLNEFQSNLKTIAESCKLQEKTEIDSKKLQLFFDELTELKSPKLINKEKLLLFEEVGINDITKKAPFQKILETELKKDLELCFCHTFPTFQNASAKILKILRGQKNFNFRLLLADIKILESRKNELGEDYGDEYIDRAKSVWKDIVKAMENNINDRSKNFKFAVYSGLTGPSIFLVREKVENNCYQPKYAYIGHYISEAAFENHYLSYTKSNNEKTSYLDNINNYFEKKWTNAKKIESLSTIKEITEGLF